MVGKVTSKGDRVMRAQVARRNFHLDGRNIRVGVISDSFNAQNEAAKDVRNGDLPGRGNPFGYSRPVRVLRDLRSGADEGRAMSQIISDIAPGSELLFHTAFTPSGNLSEQSFATAVRALARAGANIIVDDIGFAAPFFQDGAAAQAVEAVVQQGKAYFSAIGNDSNRSYESEFRPGPTFELGDKTYELHDFDPGAGVDFYQDLTLTSGASLFPLLGWTDPAGRISNDMELFLVSTPAPPVAKDNLLATSVTQFLGGVEQPLEQLAYTARASSTAYLVIARQVQPSRSPTFVKWISVANGADTGVSYQYVDPSGDAATIYGQPNAQGAVAVGAVEVRKTPVYGINPPVLDSFSSRGGTPILLDAQGNRLPAPEVRPKPEIVAPNGVTTSFEPVSGFNPFFGTSAAAPHAAAVAALLLQRAGGAQRLTPAQITRLLQQTAIPLDPPGNLRSGAGLVQADTAVLAAYQQSINGTEADDQLQGSAAADNLNGLGGADRISGSRGFDALAGGRGSDRLLGNAGNDYLLGEAGRDQLVGGKGADTLLGNAGNDRLEGNRGNDLLAGGAGRNALRGGAGRDQFVLSRSGQAVVQDFRVGQDGLLLNDRLRFGQLRQVERGSDLLIQWRGQTLARLDGISAPLSAAAFSPIALQS